MSYDNAEPKVLKTLNSDGQVLDDAGNVINDTSDYWVQLYNQTEPKVDKILKSDGTVVDAAGNLIQDTTEFNVQKYNQAEPIPAKYLHSDGTIDENPGSGSGADLEDNHQTTIDVSTYTEPVEVTPASGKDGMKKNTITLDNIPSGTATLYAWTVENEPSDITWYNFNIPPTTKEEFETSKQLYINVGVLYKETTGDVYSYTKISDTKLTVQYEEGGDVITLVRDTTKDVIIW